MSSIFSTSEASTPVSSRTSRAAASAADSPGSMCPLGSASTLPSFSRMAAIYGRPRMFRTTTPPAENSRSIATVVLDEGDEADGHHGLRGAVCGEARQPLLASAADRADEHAVGCQLLEQRWRWRVLGGGGYRDAVEGGPVRCAAAAVADAHLHVVVGQLRQHG